MKKNLQTLTEMEHKLLRKEHSSLPFDNLLSNENELDSNQNFNLENANNLNKYSGFSISQSEQDFEMMTQKNNFSKGENSSNAFENYFDEPILSS